MDPDVAETAVNILKGRHQRKVCGHCNELLSYSAYRSHRSRYYIESEQRWINSQDSISDSGSNGEMIDDPSMDFSDSKTMDDQSGILIATSKSSILWSPIIIAHHGRNSNGLLKCYMIWGVCNRYMYQPSSSSLEAIGLCIKYYCM